MAVSINFTKIAGGAVLTLTQPGYDVRLTGGPQFSVRNTTTVVPNASGAVVTGDGLADPAKLTASGKIFTASRSTTESAAYTVWTAPLWTRSMPKGSFPWKPGPVTVWNCPKRRTTASSLASTV